MIAPVDGVIVTAPSVSGCCSTRVRVSSRFRSTVAVTVVPLTFTSPRLVVRRSRCSSLVSAVVVPDSAPSAPNAEFTVPEKVRRSFRSAVLSPATAGLVRLRSAPAIR